MNKKDLKLIALGVTSYILAFVFIMAGSAKLAGAEMMVANFARWELPLWFMYLTGAVEVSAAVLLLVARVRFWGAGLAIGTMVGALMIHAIFAEWGALTVPGLLLAGSTVVAWASRPAWLPVFGREQSRLGAR